MVNALNNTSSIKVSDKAVMLIFCNINSYVNHKKSPLKYMNAVLEPQGAPCDCNLVLNKPSCGI